MCLVSFPFDEVPGFLRFSRHPQKVISPYNESCFHMQKPFGFLNIDVWSVLKGSLVPVTISGLQIRFLYLSVLLQSVDWNSGQISKFLRRVLTVRAV